MNQPRVFIGLCLVVALVLLSREHRVNALRCSCETVRCMYVNTSLCLVGHGLDPPCFCCTVCWKNLGEACGGPDGNHGRCGQGLKCKAKQGEVGKCEINIAKVCKLRKKNKRSNVTQARIEDDYE
ncbi:venom protein 302-like [Oratosquilla oratoria]|uniref:venom protein 302-like n=1 Tax=Oratosquilla oratoria TaxID=337810 RepID=UPI003F773F1C